MQARGTNILRWAGAVTMLLLIVCLIIEGTWAIPLHRSWPFVILVIIATILLFITSIRTALAPLFSHLGLALVLLGGMLGAVVKTDCKIVVDTHATERVAYDEHNQPVVLPFAIQLKDFHIDYYADGTSPKQYTSTLGIDSKVFTTSVNHPAKVDGWWIYQSDYDRANHDFVILQVVRDPWLPVVYVGFVLMVIGALLQVVRAWHSWRVIPVALVVTAIFTAASLARIELGTLVPALRSIWFFPHILIYMVSYSLLAIALIMEGINVFWGKGAQRAGKRLFTTVSAFLLIGMLCGAVWAKDAWGDYWTWDAKECWAAVTWLITVVGAHTPAKTKWHTFIAILITFAAIQVTWYGVNYLPSAQYSLHTYNK